MAESSNSLTIRFSDPKVWVLLGAAVAGQFAASKSSLSTVEGQQRDMASLAARTAERQAAMEAALTEMKASQERAQSAAERFQGEIRYRLEQVERRQREEEASEALHRRTPR